MSTPHQNSHLTSISQSMLSMSYSPALCSRSTFSIFQPIFHVHYFFTNGYDTDQWNFYDIFPKISVWCSLASPAPLTAHHSARLWLLLLHRRFFAFFMCARESYESCDPVYVEYDGSWAWHTMESSGKNNEQAEEGLRTQTHSTLRFVDTEKKAIEVRQFGMEFRFFFVAKRRNFMFT